MSNLNESKKYHFIYKTTNLINGKYYIGMHSTSNLKDGYLGSGKHLRRSIRKHGIENFKLEILEWYEDRESLTKREKEIVNKEYIKDELCMNLKPGGYGGVCDEKHLEKFLAGSSKYQKRIWKNDEYRKIHTEINRQNAIKNHKEGKISRCDWTGKHHTKESKKKIGDAIRITQLGDKNSQYGTQYITNGIESKRIKKNETIPYGWIQGRIIFITRGNRWITNEIDSKQLKIGDPIPDGWVLGRTYRKKINKIDGITNKEN